ncbi:VWA domain-containing protein [Luteitalea sp.]
MTRSMPRALISALAAALGSALVSVLLSSSLGAQPPSRLTIVEPTAEAMAVGRTTIRAEPEGLAADVQGLTFFVDGRLQCTVDAPPWVCEFDAGSTVTSRQIRVVARLRDGQRAVASVRTRNLGFTESVRVNAVQVPVIVRDGDGRFVRDLRATDFAVKENGVPQVVTQLAHEAVPLELVLAIDVSDSMGLTMGEVSRASTRFVDRLRPEDSATILAFNDNRFIVADRERDPIRRRVALAGLQAWGGTALFDAVVESVDLAARGTARKGVVIFSDGEDQVSRVTSEVAIRRVQQSDVIVYTVAFGAAATSPAVRTQLEAFAKASGGRVFFHRDLDDLDRSFAEIIEELSAQYLLSYEPAGSASRGWRTLEVDVLRRGVRVRARDGYMRTQ